IRRIGRLEYRRNAHLFKFHAGAARRHHYIRPVGIAGDTAWDKISRLDSGEPKPKARAYIVHIRIEMDPTALFDPYKRVVAHPKAHIQPGPARQTDKRSPPAKVLRIKIGAARRVYWL